jgi:putative chitinase
MSLDITDPIQALWQSCPVPLLQGIIDTADDVFAKFEMAGNRNRILHFMAQISAETGGGLPSELQENLNYSAQGLLKTFPTHFNAQQAAECAHNPQAIANRAYGGRMGNDQPNDGWLYAGKGLLQTTGKGLYRELSGFIGIDLIANPGALLAPDTALLCAVADFVCVCKCLPFADEDNLLEVSAMINVGHPIADAGQMNGWADRQAWYARWSQVLS